MAKDKITLKEIKTLETFPLHIHWDGSLPAEWIFDMAEKKGESLLLPENYIDGSKVDHGSEPERLISSSKQLKSFMHDLRRYNIGDVFSMATRFMQTPEDLRASAKVFADYLSSQNVAYAEATFAPQYHVFAGMSIDDVLICSADAFQEEYERTGIDIRLLPCIDRDISSAESTEIVKKIIDANKRYPDMILGVGLACEESAKNPPEKHLEAFKQTWDTPLKLTIHAGEMCDEETNLKYIETSIFDLKADGIGHGIELYKRPDLVNAMVERGIRLESNPRSNEFFFDRSFKEKHLDELVASGLFVSINPDDPAMIPKGETADNLYRLGKMYGREFVFDVISNSIESAWGLSDTEKDQYQLDLNDNKHRMF